MTLLWNTLDAWGFAAARYLLEALWQSTLVFAAVAALSVLLRRHTPRARRALWLSALLVAPALPWLSTLARPAGLPQQAIAEFPAYAPPVYAFDQTMPEPEPAATQDADFAASPVPTPPAPKPTDYPWALGLIAYILGDAFFFSWTLLGHLRIHQWMRSGHIVTDPVLVEPFQRAAARLGVRRSVRVVLTERVPAPLTAGIARPTVLLPHAITEILDDDGLYAIALHETVHIHQHEPLILTLASVIRSVLYFHPLVWIACRRLAVLAEHSADDAVLEITGAPTAYARLLTTFAERLPLRTPSTEGAAGLVFCKSAFLKRVEAILGDRKRIRKLTRIAFAGTVTAALVSLAAALALPLGQKQSNLGSDANTTLSEASRPDQSIVAAASLETAISLSDNASKAATNPDTSVDLPAHSPFSRVSYSAKELTEDKDSLLLAGGVECKFDETLIASERAEFGKSGNRFGFTGAVTLTAKDGGTVHADQCVIGEGSKARFSGNVSLDSETAHCKTQSLVLDLRPGSFDPDKAAAAPPRESGGASPADAVNFESTHVSHEADATVLEGQVEFVTEDFHATADRAQFMKSNSRAVALTGNVMLSPKVKPKKIGTTTVRADNCEVGADGVARFAGNVTAESASDKATAPLLLMQVRTGEITMEGPGKGTAELRANDEGGESTVEVSTEVQVLAVRHPFGDDALHDLKPAATAQRLEGDAKVFLGPEVHVGDVVFGVSPEHGFPPKYTDGANTKTGQKPPVQIELLTSPRVTVGPLRDGDSSSFKALLKDRTNDPGYTGDAGVKLAKSVPTALPKGFLTDVFTPEFLHPLPSKDSDQIQLKPVVITDFWTRKNSKPTDATEKSVLVKEPNDRNLGFSFGYAITFLKKTNELSVDFIFRKRDELSDERLQATKATQAKPKYEEIGFRYTFTCALDDVVVFALPYRNEGHLIVAVSSQRVGNPNHRPFVPKGYSFDPAPAEATPSSLEDDAKTPSQRMTISSAEAPKRVRTENNDSVATALEKTISFKMEKTHITEVAKELTKLAGVKIVVDPAAVMPSGATADASGTHHVSDGVVPYINLTNVTLEQALRALVRPMGLSFIVLDDSISITKDSQKDDDVEKGLEKSISVSWPDTTLGKATGILKKAAGIDLVLDYPSVDFKTPVKAASYDRQPAKTVLDALLAPLQLRYSVEHGRVRIGLMGDANGEPKSVDDLLGKQQAYFQRLKSIQYAVTETFSHTPPREGKDDSTIDDYVRHSTFVQEGKRYYGTGHASHGGRKEQVIGYGSSGLSLPYPEYVLPFTSWALAPKNMAAYLNFDTAQTLATKEAWDYVRENARLAGVDTVNGLACAVLRITSPGKAGSPKSHTMVYFARGFDCFPVARRCFQESASGDALRVDEEVTGLTWAKNAANEPYVAYKAYTIRLHGPNGAGLKFEYAFDTATFKINDPIPEAAFTGSVPSVPASEVARVLDRHVTASWPDGTLADVASAFAAATTIRLVLDNSSTDAAVKVKGASFQDQPVKVVLDALSKPLTPRYIVQNGFIWLSATGSNETSPIG